MKVSKRWQSFSFWLKHPFKSWCALSCMPLFTSQAPSTSFFLFSPTFFCPFSVWSPWICAIPPFSSLVCACCNPSPSPPAPGVVVLSGLHCLRNHSCSSSLSNSFNAPHPWSTSTTTFLFSIPARLVRVCNASFILWCSFTLTLRFHHPPSVFTYFISVCSLNASKSIRLSAQITTNCCIFNSQHVTTLLKRSAQTSGNLLDGPGPGWLVLICHFIIFDGAGLFSRTLYTVSNLDLIFKASPFISILHPPITDIPPCPCLRTPLL